jgi:hypothetical protein
MVKMMRKRKMKKKKERKGLSSMSISPHRRSIVRRDRPERLLLVPLPT